PHAPSRAGRTSRGRGSVPGPRIIGEAASGPGAADLRGGQGRGEPSGLPGLEDRLGSPLRAPRPRTPAPALGPHRHRRRSLRQPAHLPRARAAALLLTGHRPFCPPVPVRTVRPASATGPSALCARGGRSIDMAACACEHGVAPPCAHLTGPHPIFDIRRRFPVSGDLTDTTEMYLKTVFE